jgi:plasmid stabilization system protein ParE
MKLLVLDQAKLEINEHVAWYRDRDPDAAERLSYLFEEAVLEIVKKPTRFSLMEMRRNPGNIRRVILKNFPIYIPYQILDDEVYILAVAHASRRPGYWRKRIRK